MDRSRVTRYFTHSAAALLAALATALFLGNLAGARLTQPRDPLLGLSADVVFWILGFAALLAVLVCATAWPPRLKLACVLWFAANVVLYRAGFYWMGVTDLRGYLGGLAGAFGLPAGIVAVLLGCLFLYLLAGSAGLLLWSVLDHSEDSLVKAICARCGGHIAFAPGQLGKTLPCPHCQAAVTLRTPDNLKMSCYFCKGHIEFPPHAVGEKISCPHCKMDITLKLPAGDAKPAKMED